MRKFRRGIMDFEKTAEQIYDNIGGNNNIQTYTHCATRLRLTLKDDEQADAEKIKALDGVINVVKQGGQFQVIIGNDVKYVYQAFQNLAGDTTNNSEDDQPGKSNKSIVGRVLDTIAGIFIPLVPALAGSGMIKALLTILVLFGWIDNTGQSYKILYFMSDAVFYFLPILLAHSASVKFKTNPYVSLTVGGILLHPTFVNMVAEATQNNGHISLFNLPITLTNYGSSVIPIILVIWFMSYIEPLMDRIVPKVMRIFATPMLTLLIVAPVALVVLGPLGTILGDGLANIVGWMNNYVGWLTPMLMGAFTPFLVMTGMHYAMISVGINSLAKTGMDTVAGPGMLVSNLAQGGAVLALALRTKEVKLRALATSTGISAVLGITEPALYGVTLSRRRTLVSTMIGGGLGGLFLGIMHVGRYQQVAPSIIALPSYIGGNSLNNFYYAVIGSAIAFFVGFGLQFIIGPGDEKATNEVAVDSEQTHEVISIVSPIAGDVVSLSDVPDEVFAQGMMGPGVAIMPTEGKIYAPFDATVSVLFDTHHAIGLVNRQGAEVLIHVGMDTVSLNGKGFTPHIKQGDVVKAGDLLLEVDLNYIQSQGLSIITPVLVTNQTNLDKELSITNASKVSIGDNLMTLA